MGGMNGRDEWEVWSGRGEWDEKCGVGEAEWRSEWGGME